MAARNGVVRVTVGGAETVTIGLASLNYNPQISVPWSFSGGNASNTQIDVIGSALIPMTGSAVSVDLYGASLLDGKGDPVNPDEIVAFMLQHADGNEGDISIVTSGANGWDVAINGTITLKAPDGFLAIGARAGYPVTPGTKDLLSCTGADGDALRILALGRSEDSSSSS